MECKTIELLKKEDCTGCMACLLQCPKHCISKQKNEEGFWYPVIKHDQCVNCGACYQVCPQLNPPQYESIKQGYIGIKKDASESSSGGAFWGMAQYMVDQMGGIVCGCVMDEAYKVKHVCTDSMQELCSMQGSKYVQSDLENCFVQIREYLKQDRWVLFSGTPCQGAALSRFLNKQSTEKLIIVDLVCHGVPSPVFWEKHIKELIPDSQHGRISVKFRRKDKYERTAFDLNFSDGKKIKGERDLYYNLFLQGDSFRESCYNCRYAAEKRISDITIGDCNTWMNYMDFYPETATSIVLCNTQKGINFWNECKGRFETHDLDVEKEVRGNRQLNQPTKRKEVRNKIYEEIYTLTLKELNEMYTEKASVKDCIKRLVKRLVPVKARENIRRLIFKYGFAK